MLMVKVQFENYDKNFEICIAESDRTSISQQLVHFLEKVEYADQETRLNHYLFDVDTGRYITNYEELKAASKITKLSFN